MKCVLSVLKPFEIIHNYAKGHLLGKVGAVHVALPSCQVWLWQQTSSKEFLRAGEVSFLQF